MPCKHVLADVDAVAAADDDAGSFADSRQEHSLAPLLPKTAGRWESVGKWSSLKKKLADGHLWASNCNQ